MNVALVNSKTERLPEDMLAAARGRLPGKGSVAEGRRRAFDDFIRQGLPHRRLEQWKYTDLRAMLQSVAPLAGAPDQAAFASASEVLGALEVKNAIKLVLVDGIFAPHLSDRVTVESGVDVRSLRETLEQPADGGHGNPLASAIVDPMLSLNAAMATDGVVISVKAAASLARPLHIVHVATRSDAASFTRSQLNVGSGARVTLIESHLAAPGAKSYQTHDAIIIKIGDGAELQHIRLMEDAIDAANISTAIVSLGAKTKFNTFNLTSGGAVSRYQGFITFEGEGSELTTNGVNLLAERSHGDTTLLVDHAVPNCTSREVFRSVLDERGHSVFQGRIVVRPHAQKTDGKMMNRALLLSEDAEMDSKPELEIFADDVTCGHGSTTGALDESLLFYLRARGLSEKEAQALLIEAFVGEAIESIIDDDLREVALVAAKRWLTARS